MPRYFSGHGASSPLLASRTGAQRMLCSAKIFAASTIEQVLSTVMTFPWGGAGKEETGSVLKKSFSFALAAMKERRAKGEGKGEGKGRRMDR